MPSLHLFPSPSGLAEAEKDDVHGCDGCQRGVVGQIHKAITKNLCNIYKIRMLNLYKTPYLTLAFFFWPCYTVITSKK